jgi:Na+/melibiose symporter-like transporter
MSGVGAELSFRRIFVFSLSTLPVSALGVVLFVYLPPYLASHLGVSLVVISGAWASVRVVDLFVDPLLGHAMDRTVTPWGRYRVWLIGGVPIFAAAAYLLFLAPKGIGWSYLFFWLFVLYLGNSILSLAQSAWSATLATSYHDRSRIFGISTAVGVIAAVATLLIPVFAPMAGFSDTEGVQFMGLAIVAMTPLSVWFAAWRTPERVNRTTVHHFVARDYLEIVTKPEVLRLFFAQMALTMGPGWMSAMYLFYFQDVLHYTQQQSTILLLVYILIGVAGAPLTARAAQRFGKHRTLSVTTAAYSAALLVVPLVPKGDMLLGAPVMAWCGFMAAGFNLMVNAMMADVGDEIRLHQGKERISLLYAVLTFAGKLAAAGAIAISYGLLKRAGYDPAEGAHNGPAAIDALSWIFITGPIVFVMLGGFCVFGWKLDEAKHRTIRRELELRDASLADALPAVLNVGTVPVIAAAEMEAAELSKP